MKTERHPQVTQLKLQLRRVRSSVRTDVSTGGCGTTNAPQTQPPDSRTTQSGGKGYAQNSG